MIKRWIIKLLGIFSRTEKPTEDELIAYGAELEREKQRKGYVQIYIDPTIRSYPQDKSGIPPALQDPKYVEQIRTQIIPHVKPPAPRKLHMKRYDGPPLPGDTLLRVPTWIL